MLRPAVWKVSGCNCQCSLISPLRASALTFLRFTTSYPAGISDSSPAVFRKGESAPISPRSLRRECCTASPLSRYRCRIITGNRARIQPEARRGATPATLSARRRRLVHVSQFHHVNLRQPSRQASDLRVGGSRPEGYRWAPRGRPVRSGHSTAARWVASRSPHIVANGHTWCTLRSPHFALHVGREGAELVAAGPAAVDS